MNNSFTGTWFLAALVELSYGGPGGNGILRMGAFPPRMVRAGPVTAFTLWPPERSNHHARTCPRLSEIRTSIAKLVATFVAASF